MFSYVLLAVLTFHSFSSGYCARNMIATSLLMRSVGDKAWVFLSSLTFGKAVHPLAHMPRHDSDFHMTQGSVTGFYFLTVSKFKKHFYTLL